MKLQSGQFNIETCGAWVLARAYLQNLKQKEFQELFVYSKNKDELVATLVLLIFLNK